MNEDAPRPREYFLSGDIAKELYDDKPAVNFYISYMPDQHLLEQGLERAPGSEWNFTWHQYTQKDLDHWNMVYFGMNAPAPFFTGDWHYRATTFVVKKSADV